MSIHLSLVTAFAIVVIANNAARRHDSGNTVDKEYSKERSFSFSFMGTTGTAFHLSNDFESIDYLFFLPKPPIFSPL